VLAVRHSLSAPTWLKPTTIFFCASALHGSSATSVTAASAALTALRFIFIACLLFMVDEKVKGFCLLI